MYHGYQKAIEQWKSTDGEETAGKLDAFARLVFVGLTMRKERNGGEEARREI